MTNDTIKQLLEVEPGSCLEAELQEAVRHLQKKIDEMVRFEIRGGSESLFQIADRIVDAGVEKMEIENKQLRYESAMAWQMKPRAMWQVSIAIKNAQKKKLNAERPTLDVQC